MAASAAGRIRAAVQNAIGFQRELHVKEEEDAMAAIRAERGEILELTPKQHDRFVAAVTPIYAEARREYSRDVLDLLNV
jgi:TRAP-type C4-dicarboxylate transport system substrate-binding protein